MRLNLWAVVLAAAFAVAANEGAYRGACAQQYRILPRERLDSVANPVAAAGSPMRFGQSRIDVGTIGEDDAPSEYEYRWRNCGDEPLVITDVLTSCGCVTAEYDRRPVGIGEQGTIRVRYCPKGHPGALNRKISVYTQFSSLPSAVLELVGYVTPSAVPVHEYRHRFGPLRLKQTQVRMEGSARAVELIEVLNAGERELRIEAEAEGLPAWLSVRCEPAAIEPGAKADIEIAFDPAKLERELPERLPVVLNGVDLPADERTIYVYFGPAPVLN